MNLIILEPSELGNHGDARLSGRRADHLRQVLHVQPGHIVRVGLLDGPCGTGTVVSVDASIVHLHCHFEARSGEVPAVDLLLALPRPKVMRRLWAQLAALGVRRVILTNAERVERPYFDTHVLTPECYRPLLVEGLQQARDTHLPIVSIHRQLKILVEDELNELAPAGLRIVADPIAAVDIRTRVHEARDRFETIHDDRDADDPRKDIGADERAPRVVLAVGPEGGWNTFEMQLLTAHGFQPVGMGPRTLRSDTACVALLALVHDALRAVPRRGPARDLHESSM